MQVESILPQKDLNINYLFGYYMMVITVAFSIDQRTILSFAGRLHSCPPIPALEKFLLGPRNNTPGSPWARFVLHCYTPNYERRSSIHRFRRRI